MLVTQDLWVPPFASDWITIPKLDDAKHNQSPNKKELVKVSTI